MVVACGLVTAVSTALSVADTSASCATSRLFCAKGFQKPRLPNRTYLPAPPRTDATGTTCQKPLSLKHRRIHFDGSTLSIKLEIYSSTPHLTPLIFARDSKRSIIKMLRPLLSGIIRSYNSDKESFFHIQNESNDDPRQS